MKIVRDGYCRLSIPTSGALGGDEALSGQLGVVAAVVEPGVPWDVCAHPADREGRHMAVHCGQRHQAVEKRVDAELLLCGRFLLWGLRRFLVLRGKEAWAVDFVFYLPGEQA
jgi:hypothetical protein